MGYGPHWDMMGWGGDGWLGPFGMLFWPLLLVLVVAGAVWLVRPSTRAGGDLPPAGHHPGAVDVLAERYARGEIGREEYLQKRGDILQTLCKPSGGDG